MHPTLRAFILDSGFCFHFAIANAQQAAIRFSCDGDNRNAQLFINGKHIGDCPMDQAVPAGQMKIRAVKKWGEEQERVFELDTFLGTGGAKRVDIELGPPQLTPAARDAQQRKQEAKLRAELEEKKRREEVIAKAKAQFEAEQKQAEEFGTKAKANAEAGDVQAMVQYASHLQLGQGFRRDLSGATSWFSKAAAQGSGAGMAGVASVHYNSGRFDEARPWAEKAADAGNGRGFLIMSLLHMFGKGGVWENSSRAVEFLKRAVALEDPRALYFFGEALLGRGAYAGHFSPDRSRGYEIISKLVEPKDGLYIIPAALVTLSNLYKTGLENKLEKNEEISRLIWVKSQELGSANEVWGLGVDYMKGEEGMPQNDREALRLFRLAADENHANAICNIGFFYHHGRGGIPVDMAQALAWYQGSAILGSEQCKVNVDVLMRGR